MKLQTLFGIIPRIVGKGSCARLVTDLVLRMRRELVANLEDPSAESRIFPATSEIDSLIVIDRTVDLLTPMCTQLTYEGLIDEVYGIKSTFVELDPSIIGITQSTTSASGAPTATISNKPRKHPLNSKDDKLYNQLRDLNFAVVGGLLNQIARRIYEDYEERHQAKTVSQIKEFIGKLGNLQAEHQSLKLHVNLTEQLTKYTMDQDFNKMLEVQQNFVAGIMNNAHVDYIEEMIGKQIPVTQSLRLLCLYSLVNGGIKPKSYDFFRREIVQTYGFEHILTLQNLARVGLLRKQESTRNPYTSIRRAFRLIVDDVNEHQPNDVSYVYSGYAPITVRLVQVATTKSVDGLSGGGAMAGSATGVVGWKGWEEPTRLLPGPTFEELQKTTDNTIAPRRDRSQTRTTLVLFLGGCTFTEISAIKFLSQMEEGREYVILTTQILNVLKTGSLPSSYYVNVSDRAFTLVSKNNPPPTSTTTSLLPPPSASKLKLPSKIVSRDIKLPSFPTEAILAAASNPPSTVNSRLTTATQQQATEKTTISKKSGDMTSGNQPSQTEEFKVHTTTLKRKPESTTTASNRNTRARMDSASSTSTTASGPKRTGTVTSRLTKPTVASMNRVGKATSSTAKTATKAVEKDDDEGSSSGVPKKKKRPAWDVKGRLQDLEELHGATESRLADSNKVMTEMTSQLTESQKTIQELLLFRRSLETKVEMKEKENTHISTELSEMQTKLTSTVQRYTMEIQSLKTTHSIEINEAKMQFDALQRNFENLSNELQLSRQENAQLRSTISNHSTAMISLESDLRANKLMLEQTKDLLMTREGEIKVLEQKLADSMENCRNLEVKIREGESVRRRLHNSIQELKGNIRVFCRVRPLLPAELSDGKNPNEVLSHIAYPDVDNKAIELTQSAESGSGSSKPIQKNYPFAFDKVFQPSSTQAEVFEEISQLVQSALDGYHVCIFAYGQTGSGKTFTMEGPNNPDDMSMGMIPRAVLQIFETAQSLKDKGWEYTMEAQFLEIYNESIRDLLGNDDGTKKHDIKHLSTTKTTVTDVTTSECLGDES
ncbi:hypothetical protein HK102_005762 [Quaeritorhiza haematococci]|nr:hypothetical protein HK102_005762 [Quaeritorhiza haematococci]